MSSLSTVIRRTIKNFRLKRGKEYKSVIKQIWENLVLILRIQLEPHEYYLFRLYEKKVKKDHVITYLNSAQFSRDINPVLNPPQWHHMLNDKLVFNHYFRNLGIPVAHQYGFYSEDFGFLNNGGNLSSRKDFLDFLLMEKPENLVLKPHDTFGGLGIFIFNNIQYDTDIIFRSSNGTTLTYSELSAKLDSMLKEVRKIKGFVVEAVIGQHPVLQKIYPHSVNTLRILTYLTKDGRPKILGTRIRMGRNGNLVDNISQGGIHATIDIETGMITGGLSIISREQSYITDHPDTGARFKGIEIPHWPQILDLCRKAAKVTPLQRFVGWDIAVGESGPVVIEGNSTGVEVAYDQLGDRGFMTEEFRNDMLAYGIRFPDRLPEINPVKIYQSYKISRRLNKVG
jgi:glutathione synthase/RimK-type ligase-like ATP-grasp enzyme